MDPIQLDYQTPPSGGRNPRYILWIAAGLVALVLGGTALEWHTKRSSLAPLALGPPALPVPTLYTSCANDSPPANGIAFEDVPVTYPPVPESVILTGWDGKPRRGRQPMDWFNIRYMTYPQVWPDDPVLFLHELHRPGQPPRLVLIHARVSEDRVKTRVAINAALMQSRFARPVNALECLGPVLTDLRNPKDAPVRIYAGQLDPNDPAHFSIRCQVNDTESLVDGWLSFDSKSPIREAIEFK